MYACYRPSDNVSTLRDQSPKPRHACHYDVLLFWRVTQSQSSEPSRGTCHEASPFCVRFEYDEGSSVMTWRMLSFQSPNQNRVCSITRENKQEKKKSKAHEGRGGRFFNTYNPSDEKPYLVRRIKVSLSSSSAFVPATLHSTGMVPQLIRSSTFLRCYSYSNLFAVGSLQWTSRVQPSVDSTGVNIPPQVRRGT